MQLPKSKIPMKLIFLNLLVTFALLSTVRAEAQLSVMVSPVNAAGNKAVVKLDFRNGLTNAVESARASVYLFNGDKVVSQETRWVIGGAKDKPSLAPGA